MSGFFFWSVLWDNKGIMKKALPILLSLLLFSSASQEKPMSSEGSFIWHLAPDGTYQAGGAVSLRDDSGMRAAYVGPHVNMPDYELQITTGGSYCYSTPYFWQKDRRWKNAKYGPLKFGPTGCVPTALAMIISGIKGYEILPLEIGDYLYFGTNQFNRPSVGASGASSRAVVLAAEHYGVRYELLKSYEDFERALREGKCVYLAVNYIRGLTHAFVCLGYQDGYTFVKDSDNYAYNHLYKTEELWARRSQDLYDNNAGTPAIALWE